VRDAGGPEMRGGRDNGHVREPGSDVHVCLAGHGLSRGRLRPKTDLRDRPAPPVAGGQHAATPHRTSHGPRERGALQLPSIRLP